MARGQLMLPFCMELLAMLPPTPMDTLATPHTLPSLPLSLGASLLALLQGLPLEKAQAQATLYLVNLCLIIYSPMVPGTWARGLLMLNQRLKLLFSTKLMAMLATPPLTPTDILPTLTPMVATPLLMVPDMAHTPTWDKMFTTPSMQSIHTELKLSVMARGLLKLMAM